jgi:hypothetical protein
MPTAASFQHFHCGLALLGDAVDLLRTSTGAWSVAATGQMLLH